MTKSMDKEKRKKTRSCVGNNKPSDLDWLSWRDKHPAAAARLVRGEVELLPVATPEATQPKLGPVAVLNGQGRGVVAKASDPDGRIVAQARRLDASPIDRMLLAGTIDRGLHGAGERFERDFVRGQLHGLHATQWLRGGNGSGPGEVADAVVAARHRVAVALRCLGRVTSVSARCVWWVVGCGATLDEFEATVRGTGGRIDRSKAAGVLIGALERLAVHYGHATMGDLHEAHYRRGFSEGLDFALDLSTVSAADGDDPVEAIKAQVARIKARTLQKNA